MPDALLLLLLTGLPFCGALAAGLLTTNARNAATALAGATALASLALVWAAYPAISAGAVLRHKIPWMPSLGLSLVLRMDGLAWLFAGLITGIGSLVVLYARYYVAAEDPVPRFFSFFLAFMGSMNGLVLSGNLIQLVFFWELTSLFSFLLIGYRHQTAAARDGARMALTVTAAGGLCLLASALVIGHIVGSFDLDAVLAAGDRIRSHPLYVPALVLLLLGCFTKSAQFPFHFWLPHAMAAPTPISAYLHSATLVKGGVFLLARLWPVLAETELWFWTVGTAGLVTLLFGAYVAIFQNDLKGLLAYSTISHLGLITLLLGLNSRLGLVAAIFHIVNHATFKASLFMAAGIIDHETGTRDIRRLSGLQRSMPFTARLAMVAAAAMAGVPLLNGFISKEMFFAAALSAHGPYPAAFDLLPAAAVLASAFSVAYSLRFIHGAFFGPDPVDLPRAPQEPPAWMRFPVEILVLACIFVGVLPSATVGPFLDSAARSVLGSGTPEYSLAVWHGFNMPLVMSLIALGVGVILYVGLQPHLLKGAGTTPLLARLEGQRLFERALVFLSWRLARSLERLVGTRRLQPQLRLLLLVALLAATAASLARGIGPGNLLPHRVDPVFALVWAAGPPPPPGGGGGRPPPPSAALILLGGAGLVVCVTYVWFSAPDVALTQILVEIVTTVLLLLGLRWLPKRFEDAGGPGSEPVPLARRLTDLGIAAAAGAGMAVLAFDVMTRAPPELLAEHFLARAYREGGGTNVVNVILVDFRGFDTLGEIAVLAAVALVSYALLRRFRPAAESVAVPEQQREQSAYEAARPDRSEGDTVADWLMVPAVITRLLFPVIGLVALFLLLRGHDLPGGGFVAGLTAAIALILQYVIGGARWIEDRLVVQPRRWMGAGLLLAVLTGLAAWIFGRPFLTSSFGYVTLPVVGTVPAASALVFDLGVFALVVGATALILIALAHQSLRGHRSVPAEPAPAPERPGPDIAGAA
ncbi:MAG: monovalent cation/H+ antiporter subunit A [Xanthobacteraceae bacterium]|nr:monovalent cation/H+ antiporter subunit A [Xanthobacteraceae bacterium]